MPKKTQTKKQRKHQYFILLNGSILGGAYKKTAEEIEINKDSLIFKVPFFRFAWNWNIMNPIEKGRFKLIASDNATTLTYEFFMYRIITVATVFSIVASIISGQIGAGVFFFTFSWLNWVITLIRHNGLFDDIEWEINQELKTGIVTVD
ncbi:MAG: hypothetical protein HYZ44_16845 [Bacteroidetes bacterium]|nr:hypothetical protein [Bacteroidota bacterium]